jgi:hypothetical protein
MDSVFTLILQKETQTLMNQGEIEDAVKEAVSAVSPWLERLARLGYVAKGTVYLVIGLLAVRVAINGYGRTEDAQGALYTIEQQPFGRLLLAVAALGFLGYAVWLFVRASLDVDHKGSNFRGVLKRTGYAITAMVHLGLTYLAVRMIFQVGHGNSDRSAVAWTALLMQQPYGIWLVGLVGLTIIGIGLYRFYQAYTAGFQQEMKLAEMEPPEKLWTTWLGRLGLTAQGIVFWVIGGFFIQAAVKFDPSEARGLDGALQSLAVQPFGQILLGVVALGLTAHGIYLFSQARYHQVKTT